MIKKEVCAVKVPIKCSECKFELDNANVKYLSTVMLIQKKCNHPVCSLPYVYKMLVEIH